MIEIRPFTDTDFDDFYAIRRESLVTAPEAFLTKLEDYDKRDREGKRHRFLTSTDMSNPNRMIVGAWVNGEIKGTSGMVRFDQKGFDHQMTIWGVFTSASTRKLGLGRQMMEMLFQKAAEIKGVTELVLGVMKTNHNAIGFYKTIGMIQFSPAENSPLLADAIPNEEIFMVYHLTNS